MNRVEIYEVGPRDGFQNVKNYIPLETKIEIIDGLVEAGVKHIQMTSFVSPKAIPQMKDAREVASYCLDKHDDLDFFALVPNLRGASTAVEIGLDWVSYVTSLSESHNLSNIRRSHSESLGEFYKIRESHPELGVCLDLATTFGCPFEGMKNEEDVMSFIKPYVEGGIESLNLCDTIGIANPSQVRRVIETITSEYPGLDLHVHIHDTRNMGMVNTLAAIEIGVLKVQSTLGGLGGCPYAPGASGNLATEDLVFMLAQMGYESTIHVEKLIKLAKNQARRIPNGQFSGHLYKIEKEKIDHE